MKNVLLSIVWLLSVSVATAQSVQTLSRQFLAYKAQGQNFQADQLFEFTGKNQNRQGSYFKLQLNRQALQGIYTARPQAMRLSIPNPEGQAFELELVQVFPVKEGAVFSTSSAGAARALQYQPGLHYRGRIAGAADNSSLAAVSIFKNGLMAIIATESANWNLGPAANDFSQTGYILSNDQDQKVPAFECHTPDDDAPAKIAKKLDNSLPPFPTVNCVDVFFVADNDLYQDQGADVVQTMDYITAVFNLVATIYANEDINIRLSGIMVWDTADPFNETDSQEALNSFEQEILSAFTGDVAILMAIDDNNGGRARREFVCDSDDARHGYCDLDVDLDPDINNYSWDANVTAHELGHLVGSHHTHWCGWVGGPIDDCFCQGIADGNFDPPASGECREPTNASCAAGPIPAVGTIMSYCHGANGVGVSFVTSNGGGFGPQPRAAIINYLECRPCLDVCDCPADLVPADIDAIIDAGDPPVIRKFVAGNSITSNSEITVGTMVKFDAGNFIRLTPGFWARSGCEFHAYIDGCQAPVIGDFRSKDAQELAYQNTELKIIPNPSSGYAILNLELAQATKLTISVHTLAGELVYRVCQSKDMPAGFHQFSLQEQALPAGVYLVLLHSGQLNLQQKWVVLN
jgi:hypothetical protein